MLFFIVSLKKVFLILPFACLRMIMIYIQALMIMIYTHCDIHLGYKDGILEQWV